MLPASGPCCRRDLHSGVSHSHKPVWTNGLRNVSRGNREQWQALCLKQDSKIRHFCVWLQSKFVLHGIINFKRHIYADRLILHHLNSLKDTHLCLGEKWALNEPDLPAAATALFQRVLLCQLCQAQLWDRGWRQHQWSTVEIMSLGKILQQNVHPASHRHSWGFSASHCTESGQPRTHFGVRALLAEDELPGLELLVFLSYWHNLWIFVLFCLNNTQIAAKNRALIWIFLCMFSGLCHLKYFKCLCSSANEIKNCLNHLKLAVSCKLGVEMTGNRGERGWDHLDQWIYSQIL